MHTNTHYVTEKFRCCYGFVRNAFRCVRTNRLHWQQFQSIWPKLPRDISPQHSINGQNKMMSHYSLISLSLRCKFCINRSITGDVREIAIHRGHCLINNSTRLYWPNSNFPSSSLRQCKRNQSNQISALVDALNTNERNHRIRTRFDGINECSGLLIFPSN